MKYDEEMISNRLNQSPAPRRRGRRWLLICGLAFAFMLALGVGALIGSTGATQAAALTFGSANSSQTLAVAQTGTRSSQTLTFSQGNVDGSQPLADGQRMQGQ
ncbi:MAG TPA: hypothetical protein DCS90_14350, partial [Ktedonobacter sp.]|nr:hypothetical protein [Ktedonobacter sp.]